MKLLKSFWWTCFLLTVAAMLLGSCVDSDSSRKRKIGFSQCTGGDAWRRQMLAAMKGEMLFHPDLELLYKDAVGNTEQQIRDIEAYMNEDVDLLIVSPNVADPITPVVEKAFRAGIPVIIVDRKTSSSLYTAYVGANNYEIGRLVGQYIGVLLEGKGKMVEIVGLRGSSPAIDRHDGFLSAIKQYPGISVVEQIDGMWEVDTARHEVEKRIAGMAQIDLVFAHNDVMAYGAYSVIKAHQLNGKIKFIGVDGLQGPGAGMQLVDDGVLTATFLYPTGGEEAIRIASRILHQEAYEKENLLHSTTIDQRNVRVMKLQSDKIQMQQKDIVRQQDKINRQISTYYNQRILIYTLLTGLVVMIIVGGLAIRGWREKIETNRQLEEYNHKIIEQRNEISEMAQKAEAATQEKIWFFTNISHEFRTPLSLILLPIEELLASSKELKSDVKEGLTSIKRNAIRLLRLVNQLMDFRKFEEKKMKIQASEMDIVKFIRGAMVSFEKMALRKKIDFRLQTDLDDLRVWFDADKMDKVVFNLLSNAFKFTKEGGQILVTVTISETGDDAVIFFDDTGVGMTPEDAAHAFDRFYMGENAGLNGTGLGLSLSKEFVALHHGNLSVSSERWKGTRFCLRLLMGRAHLESDEFAAQIIESIMDPFYSINGDDPGDLAKQTAAEDARLNEKTILLIDDNLELVNFIKARLAKAYNVIVAHDGPNGLQQAFETVPDLIVCDVLLPGKSGIDVTKILKSDLRTSHIPVIILTARGALEQKIEGIQIGADEYISKPFVFEYLNERIKALIISRERLKDHYSHDIHIEPQVTSPGQLDRRFIHEFKAIVEKNLSRADFNVNDISRELGMSRIQVYRKVSALFGYSIHDFLINVRLKKAKSMLLETDKPIADIAFEVGFSTAAYFSTAFKSKTGQSPKEFKNQYLVKS